MAYLRKNSKPMKKSLIITGLLLLAGCSLFDSEDLILRKRRDETGSWMGSGPKMNGITMK